MVIFNSDNGLFTGEHKLVDKRAAYEESLRVPMLVRYPKLGLTGKVMDAAVLNLDIPETREMDSRSAPLILTGCDAKEKSRCSFRSKTRQIVNP